MAKTVPNPCQKTLIACGPIGTKCLPLHPVMGREKVFRFKQFAVLNDRTAMKVGTDGVLLGAWCPVTDARRVLDVGTGCGVIALMVAQRNASAVIDAIDNGVPEWEKKNYGAVLEKNERKYHLPLCDKCGGLIKPDVVLYEEGLDDHTWYLSQKYISEADVLIVAGTSLVVYPAAGLVNYYKGHKLILINLSETGYDDEADLVLHKKLGEVFDGLCERL